MPVMVAAPLFVLAACVSLATSWLLVSRLERVGERLGLSEALLGMLAALAADAPEITAAITALVNREQRVGAGVVLGSNVFNLAALLGLGALVAGAIRFRRRVVILGGLLALWIAAACLVTVLGVLPPAPASPWPGSRCWGTSPCSAPIAGCCAVWRCTTAGPIGFGPRWSRRRGISSRPSACPGPVAATCWPP